MFLGWNDGQIEKAEDVDHHLLWLRWLERRWNFFCRVSMSLCQSGRPHLHNLMSYGGNNHQTKKLEETGKTDMKRKKVFTATYGSCDKSSVLWIKGVLFSALVKTGTRYQCITPELFKKKAWNLRQVIAVVQAQVDQMQIICLNEWKQWTELNFLWAMY